jgi:energy-coupling factor transporter ATP-binding protein EcfA2
MLSYTSGVIVLDTRPSEERLTLDTVILTTELRKSFPSKGGPIEAVRGVSIEVQRGEIFGFLGPNGAGKTTTLRMLTTLLPIGGGSATTTRELPTGLDESAGKTHIAWTSDCNRRCRRFRPVHARHKHTTPRAPSEMVAWWTPGRRLLGQPPGGLSCGWKGTRTRRSRGVCGEVDRTALGAPNVAEPSQATTRNCRSR